MSFARLGHSLTVNFHDISQPSSNFQFVDRLLPGSDSPAVRRLFSQSRQDDHGKTVVIEEIEPLGAVEDEINELATLFPSYKCMGLKRLTFWKKLCAVEADLAGLCDDDLLGYAILKEDAVSGVSGWHVFESVFRKYPHHHNCVPRDGKFSVSCGIRTFNVSGVMYCQQNGLNKACAHVALRSLLSRLLPNQDVFYREMNDIVRKKLRKKSFDPSEGLTTNQIGSILDYYNILYDDLRYPVRKKPVVPYSRFLYAGIENGYGGLLGFELSRQGLKGVRHIIPFYGHTFNQDSWVPRADQAYFHIGGNTKYIPSEEWLGSFIGHDDNFGSNFCVPRNFLLNRQVKYVVALRPPNTAYGAVAAEAIGVEILYSMNAVLRNINNYWIQRLVQHINNQDVVLRTLYMSGNEYVAHLQSARDWQGNTESVQTTQLLRKNLPEHLWIVEVSIPELFPANYRKLGEIVLDAQVSISNSSSVGTPVLLARVPGAYFLKNPGIIVPSTLKSHVAVYRG